MECKYGKEILGTFCDECVCQKLLNACEFKENWDGYGGKPTSKAAIKKAMEFLKVIRIKNFQTVDFVPEPDGCISMNWENPSENKIFTISFSDELIYYSGIFGLTEIRGREIFDGIISKTYIQNIFNVFSL
jgi:hypothetical protein